MLREALAAPVRSADAVPTLVVGGALVAFSALLPTALAVAATRNPVALAAAPLALVVPLVLLGYELRVMRAGARGTTGTPSFVDWAGLFRGGIASVVVSAIYLLPALAVAAGGVALAVDFDGPGGLVAASTSGATAAFWAGAALGAVFLLGFLYVRPAALATYATTGRLRAAVGPRRVLGVATTREYAVGWVLAGVTLVVGLAVAVPLAVLLVGVPLAFYVRVVAASLYGRSVGTALGVDPDEAPDEAPGAEEGSEGDSGGPAAADEPPTAEWASGGLVGEGDPDASDGVSGPSPEDAPSPVSGVPADELDVVPDGAEESRLADPDEAFASFDVGNEAEWADEELDDEWADEEQVGTPDAADEWMPESGADVRAERDPSNAADADDGFEWGATGDAETDGAAEDGDGIGGEESPSGEDRGE